MSDELQDYKKEWKILFDVESPETLLPPNIISVRFVKERRDINNEDNEKLKNCLKNLGKWEDYKRLKKDLEN